MPSSHTPRRALAGALTVLALAAAACGSAATTTTAATSTTRAFPTGTGGAIGPTTTTAPPTSTTRPPRPSTTLPVIDVEPGYGGEAVIGSESEPGTLNPFAPSGSATAWDRYGQLYLVGISDVAPASVLVPEVLTELPTEDNGGITVGEDGTMTVRLEIREEARWADGVPISGDDFLFTYRALIGLEGFTPPGGADPGLYSWILPDSLVVAPKGFSFTMERPTVQHELLFSVVLPAHQVAGTDLRTDWQEAPWVSGGPFVFDSWDPGVSMTFVRNPNYWKTDAAGLQLPYLDRVVFRFYPSGAELVDAFRVGEVDVANPPPAMSVIDALNPLSSDGAAVFVEPGTLWEHLAFQFGERNRNRSSLNRFPEFRQAVARAIDLEALNTSLFGGYNRPLTSYVEAYTPSLASGAWSEYAYDPVEARRLLALACEQHGQPCDVEPPVVVFSTTANGDLRVRMAALLQPMLADVGIVVRLELEDSGLFFGETLTAGTWDLGEWAYPGAPGATALLRAHDLFDPAGPPPYGSNYARWGTAAVEGAGPVAVSGGTGEIDVDQGPSTVRDAATRRFERLRRSMDDAVDLAGLAPLVRQAESLLADEAAIIPLFSRLWIGAVWLTEIGGSPPIVVVDTWNIAWWYRVDRTPEP